MTATGARTDGAQSDGTPYLLIEGGACVVGLLNSLIGASEEASDAASWPE
jgi:hypothetical protein